VSFSCVMTLSVLEWLIEIFNDTKHRAVSLRDFFHFSFIRTYFCSRLELTKHSSSDETSLPRDGTQCMRTNAGPGSRFRWDAQATRSTFLHVMIPRCSPCTGQGVPRVGSTFLYDVRLGSYGASNLRNFRILASVGGTCAPPSALLVILPLSI